MIRLMMSLLLVCSASFAGEADGVDAFLANFYADFNGRNIERLSNEYFHPGAQAVFGEHVSALANPDDVRTMFLAIIGGLEQRGYHHSVTRDVSKMRLGDSYALATVLIDRVMADGKKIDTVCSTYSMVKVESGWRILTWIPTDPLSSGRCV